MASVGSILSGSPAKINASLLPSGVGVDSLNALSGDVTINAAVQTGITVATVGQDVQISAPTLLPKQIVQLQNIIDVIGAGALPAGFTETAMGAPFSVPADGLYLVECSASFDVDAINGVTWGADDWISVYFLSVPPGQPGAGCDLKPWTVPASADNDYGLSATTIAVLDSAQTYQAFYSTNINTGSTIPSTTVALEVVSLCS